MSLIHYVKGALNWATGETVLVKEIQLSNFPKAELGEIMVSYMNIDSLIVMLNSRSLKTIF